MPVRLHVVVDVGLGLFPFPQLVAVRRQRPQGGLVQLVVQLEARPGHFLKGPFVELFQTVADGDVDGPQREKGLVSQPGQDAALGM